MRRERGVVLVSVLFAMVLLAAIAGGALFAALQEARTGRTAQAAVRAALDARAAAAAAIAAWDPASYNTIAPGDSLLAGGATVRRLTATLFAVEATGADTIAGAEQRRAVLVRLDPPDLPPAGLYVGIEPAADVLSGVTSIGRAPPPGWDCSLLGDSMATASLQLYDTYSSQPPLGAWDWGRLASWGARNVVADSFRLVYTAGDLEVSGGRLVGVVAAEGDVLLSGDAEIVGAVLARGAVRAQGLGGRILGVVVAASAELTEGAASGVFRLQASTCAAGLAYLHLFPARPLKARSGAYLR